MSLFLAQKLFEKVKQEGVFQLDDATYLSTGENLMAEDWYNDEDYDFEKDAIYLWPIGEGEPEEVTEEDLAKYIVDQCDGIFCDKLAHFQSLISN